MPRFPKASPAASGLSDQIFSQLAAAARETTEPVAPLHVGDTWMDPPPAAFPVLEGVPRGERFFNYAPVVGNADLVAALGKRLSERFGVERGPGEIQIVSGATAGLSVVANALLQPGDEVLLPSPFWPLIRGILKLRQAVVKEVPVMHRLSEGVDWEKELESRIGDKTSAIYLNSPNNPCGSELSEADLQAIGAIAEKHDLWVLCDDVYDEVYFGKERGPIPWLVPSIRKRAVVVHSFSKSYGMAGARVGYVHGPANALAAIRASQTFTTYCAPRPMQAAALAAFLNADQWLATMRKSNGEGARRAAELLNVAVPTGGTFLLVNADAGVAEYGSPLGFLKACLGRGVLFTPGGACGEGFENWVRICISSLPPEKVAQAVSRVADLF